jgi:hypothetical protein
MDAYALQLDPTRRSVESRDFEAELRRKIVGQDEAVQAVVDLYQVFRAGLHRFVLPYNFPPQPSLEITRLHAAPGRIEL